jgi:hypothetical protein
LAAPYLVAHTGEGHWAQVCEVAWLPWSFLAFESVRARRPGGVAALAMVLAMSFLAGHVQESYYLVLILTIWTVVDSVGSWCAGETAQGLSLVARWLAACTIAVALCAVDLVPTWTFSREMIRASGLSAGEGGAIGVGLVNLFQLLNPFALGGPDSYAGRDKFFWESLLAFGLVPLVLAAIGVFKSWQRYPTRRITWSVLIAIAFAFGSGSPIFELLFRVVPGIAMFRVPSRVLFVCSLWIALLAASGIEALLAGSSAPSRLGTLLRRLVLVGLGLGLIATCVVRVARELPHERGETALSSSDAVVPAEAAGSSRLPLRRIVEQALRRTIGSRATWAVLFVTTGLVLAAERWPRHARTAIVLIALVGAAELVSHAQRMLDVLPAASLHWPPPIRLIDDDAPLSHGGEQPFRVLASQELLSDLSAWEHAIVKAQGYDPLPLRRYAEFISALSPELNPTAALVGSPPIVLSRCDRELVDLLGVRFVLQNANEPAPDGWIRREDFTLENAFTLGRGRPSQFAGVVYENPTALPRAFIVGRSRVEKNRSDAVAALVSLDPRAEAIVNAEYLPPGPRAEFAAANVVAYTPNRVTIDVELEAPGYLILTDVWYPGWTATDNGQRTSVIPGNVAFRVVPLAAGKRRVEFRYRPNGLAAALPASVAAWFAVIGPLLWARLRRSRSDA